jgi:hypothetical protein
MLNLAVHKVSWTLNDLKQLVILLKTLLDVLVNAIWYWPVPRRHRRKASPANSASTGPNLSAGPHVYCSSDLVAWRHIISRPDKVQTVAIPRTRGAKVSPAICYCIHCEMRLERARLQEETEFMPRIRVVCAEKISRRDRCILFNATSIA